MQRILLLDLKDDPALIAAYEEHHRAVWPEVLSHLARYGVTAMKIHRLGCRMVMTMTTDDAVFDAARFAAAAASDPVIGRWEALMWTYQAATPWTPAGTKWTPMECIFDWTAPGGN